MAGSDGLPHTPNRGVVYLPDDSESGPRQLLAKRAAENGLERYAPVVSSIACPPKIPVITLPDRPKYLIYLVSDMLIAWELRGAPYLNATSTNLWLRFEVTKLLRGKHMHI